MRYIAPMTLEPSVLSVATPLYEYIPYNSIQRQRWHYNAKNGKNGIDDKAYQRGTCTYLKRRGLYPSIMICKKCHKTLMVKELVGDQIEKTIDKVDGKQTRR